LTSPLVAARIKIKGGSSITQTKLGKAYFIQDFIFDTGKILKESWGVK
jgi:hypothetical protein